MTFQEKQPFERSCQFLESVIAINGDIKDLDNHADALECDDHDTKTELDDFVVTKKLDDSVFANECCGHVVVIELEINAFKLDVTEACDATKVAETCSSLGSEIHEDRMEIDDHAVALTPQDHAVMLMPEDQTVALAFKDCVVDCELEDHVGPQGSEEHNAPMKPLWIPGIAVNMHAIGDTDPVPVSQQKSKSGYPLRVSPRSGSTHVPVLRIQMIVDSL